MKYIVNKYETRLREIESDKGDTLLTTNFEKGTSGPKRMKF